jgi:hypothetical protein
LTQTPAWFPESLQRQTLSRGKLSGGCRVVVCRCCMGLSGLYSCLVGRLASRLERALCTYLSHLGSGLPGPAYYRYIRIRPVILWTIWRWKFNVMAIFWIWT